MNLLYTVNPRRRRSKSKGSKSRKHRSAAQRAATRRMLAANRRGSRKGVRASGKRSRRRFRRNPSGRIGRAFSGIRSSGAVGLLQNGFIGGAGAVTVDVAMGYAGRVLPAAVASPVNSDGSANWAYVGTKAALALALGIFGRRIPVVGRFSGQMAEGALTVLSYQILRPMVPNAIALGYFNPTPTMRPRVSGVRRYVSGAGAYSALAVRANGGMGRGAGAAQVIDITASRRNNG